MAQQSERHLPLHQHVIGPLRQQPEPILRVLLAGRGDELEDRAADVLARRQKQPPPLTLRATVLPIEQREQRLLAGRLETARHLLVPTSTGSELGDERSELRQRGRVEIHREPAGARRRRFEKQDHQDGDQTADRDAVLQQAARESRELLGKYHAGVPADADPERHTSSYDVAMVDSSVHDLGHATYETQRQQHGDEGGRHRARDSQQQGECLGQERQAEHHCPGRDPDAAGADPGELHRRDTDRGRLGRHDPGDAGQQLGDPVGGYGTLHRPGIHGPWPAPRYALDANRSSDRLDGADEGHEQEGRKKPDERRAELGLDARPRDRRQTDPRGGRHAVQIVESEPGGDRRAGDDPCHRRPRTQPRRPLERDGADHEHGRGRGHRRARPRYSIRHFVQATEDDRQHGSGDQHLHRAHDGRGHEPPKQREPRGNQDRQQRRDDDQAGEQRGTALDERGDGDADDGRGWSRAQNVPRTEPADSDRLQRRQGATDRHRAENRPGQVRLGAAGGSNHDRGNQHETGDTRSHQLQPATERESPRRILVGFVANGRRSIRVTGADHLSRAHKA